MLEYKTTMFHVHTHITVHNIDVWDNELNRYASEGWRLVQGIQVDDVRYMLVWEREKQN